MFMSQILISCVLVVAAQASYISGPKYGAVLGGYAAQIQPRATLSVGGYGGYGSGYAPGYGSGYGVGPISSYGSLGGNNAAAALNAEAINLASSVFALPDAGGPIASSMNVPLYSTTAYTSPSVVAVPAVKHGANGSTAAAAASNVDKNHATILNNNYGHSAGY